MPNPKRAIIQEVMIRAPGGNIHLREPMKATEQVRLFKKAARKLRGK